MRIVSNKTEDKIVLLVTADFWHYMSGDKLSAQNSLKDSIKFIDSLLDIDFYSLTIMFSLDYSLTSPYFSLFSLDKIGNSLIVKAKP